MGMWGKSHLLLCLSEEMLGVNVLLIGDGRGTVMSPAVHVYFEQHAESHLLSSSLFFNPSLA